MTHDTPRPRDNAADFDDPAELARGHDREAERLRAKAGKCDLFLARRVLAIKADFHSHEANHYRAFAARGEKVPRF